MTFGEERMGEGVRREGWIIVEIVRLGDEVHGVCTSSESVALGKIDICGVRGSGVSPETSIPAMHLLQPLDLRAAVCDKEK